MEYDPKDRLDRELLADRIVSKLTECGFTEEPQNLERCQERVFSWSVSEKLRVVVYTTIAIAGSTRGRGKDSIRVCGVYTARDDTDRGVVKIKRIHRVGKIDKIVGRMYQRMRDVWALTAVAEKCHCGAPKCMSKKGKPFCADICWKTLEQLEDDKRARQMRYREETAVANYWRDRNRNRGRRPSGSGYRSKPEPEPEVVDGSWNEPITK